jgi:hypothetical protein
VLKKLPLSFRTKREICFIACEAKADFSPDEAVFEITFENVVNNTVAMRQQKKGATS